MKVILLVFCLVAIIPISPVFGQEEDHYSNGLPNGQYWADLDERSKEDMIFGLLMGYEWGYADGVVLGKEKNSGSQAAPTMPMFFARPKQYVKKIDSFYDRYPLCKKLDLLNVFGNLLSFWHKETFKLAGNKNVKDISYKQIGEMCSRVSKR
jgi:hypothetical protein